MKRVIGASMLNGVIEIIEKDAFKCICVESLKNTTGFQPYTEYIKGEIYDCVIDKEGQFHFDANAIINPYSVFFDNNDTACGHYTQEQFNRHFISVEEHRNKSIDNIIK